MKLHIVSVILALVALSTGPGPGTVSHAGQSMSAADLYRRVYRVLDHAPRFVIVMRTTYLTNGKWISGYTSRLRYIAPHRALASSRLGEGLGTSWQVQVNNSYCSWDVGPHFHRIFCRHLSWDHSAVSLAVDNLPGQIHVAQAHFSFGHGTDAVRQIKVTGRAALGCPGGRFCPPRAGALVGVLTVDPRRLLPLSFTAVIGSRPADQRLSLVYHYSHRFTVVLPTGPRVPCPPYAPSHGWCLSQR